MHIAALPNARNSQHGIPNGSLTIMKLASRLDPKLIPARLFSTLTVYKIGDDENIDERTLSADQLNAALQSCTGDGVQMKRDIILQHTDSTFIGSDAKFWKPSIGQSGWVSISKHEERRFDPTYYLVIFNGNDAISQELNDVAHELDTQSNIHAIDPEKINSTFADFIARPEYRLAKSVARRNNDRLAYAISKKLGFNLAKQREDECSLIDIVSKKPPLLAVPESVNYFGQISKQTYFKDGRKEEVIAIYNNCGTGSNVNKKCAVPLNPIDGVLLVENFVSSTLINPRCLTSCVPCGVGHDAQEQELDTPRRKYFERCAHWEGKAYGKVHKSMQLKHRSVEAVESMFANKSAKLKRVQHVCTTLSSD
jgi:hypothetical protein